MSSNPSPERRSSLDQLPAEAAEAAADPRRQLRHYVLVKEIGRGGMGSIWKAWDRTLTRWVAIKFLTVEDPEALRRFSRESMLAARLSHPNIAPIFEVGEMPGGATWETARPFIVMEYIEGKSLASQKLSVTRAVEVMVQVSRAVDFAHRLGVIHRDLKPHNIMLTPEGWPYVMDFGMAKSVQAESSLSSTGAIMGTPPYMAPEQAQGALDEVDARSDVYSLGATLYHLLCGRPPFGGTNMVEVLFKVMQTAPPAPRSLNEAIPENLEAILLGALAKRKDARPASAAAFAEQLEAFLRGAPREEPVRASRSGALIALVAGAVLIAAAVVVALRPPGSPPVPAAVPRVVETPPAPEDPPLALDYDRFDPAAPAPKAFPKIGKEWLDGELRKAGQDFEKLRPDAEQEPARRRIERLHRWCLFVEAALDGNYDLRESAQAAGKLAALARASLQPRGTFSLMISIDPFAEITGMKRDGQAIKPAQGASPAILENLQIGDYELELRHPGEGTRTVRLRASDLKQGQTWKVSGRMSEPELRVGLLP